MNTKLLSLLFIFFLGIGLSSCSKENNESGYDAGKSQGKKFRTAVNEVSPVNPVAISNLISIYQKYKENSSDADWKRGFPGGATNFDESKYAGLESILAQRITAENILTILPGLIQAL